MAVQSFALNCQTVSSGKNHLLQKCEAAHVLTLTGTPVERARAHGELMKNYLSQDIYKYFEGRLAEEMDHMNFFARNFMRFVYHFWIERFYSKTPKFLYEEMQAQAEGAGVELSGLKRALALPDTSTILVNFYERGFTKTFLTFGCTSVARKMADGTFVYGRNLDFPSATIYDKHPLITIQIPNAESKELRHITFGADGLQFGGITGVNEAGIAFAVHQLLTRDSNTFGLPMVFVGELVLRQAHTLDEAVETIKKNLPGPMWTFVITDLNQQETWSVEASATKVVVRKMQNDLLVQTNHILANDPIQKEIAYSGFKTNSEFRMKKVSEIINLAKSNLLEQTAKALSFQSNAKGELSASRDVLKGETIQTILFEKSKKTNKIFVSFDPAPVASGRFLEFQFQELLDGKESINYSIQDFLKTPMDVRLNQMKTAHAAYLLDLKKYKELIDLYSDQSTFDSQLIRAYSYLKLSMPEKSLELLSTMAADFSQATEEMKFAKPWIEIISYLKLGKNDEAFKIANSLEVEKINDKEFVRLIQRVRQKEFTQAAKAELTFSLFSGYLSQRPGI